MQVASSLVLTNGKAKRPTELVFQDRYGRISQHAWASDNLIVIGFMLGEVSTCPAAESCMTPLRTLLSCSPANSCAFSWPQPCGSSRSLQPGVDVHLQVPVLIAESLCVPTCSKT